MPADSFHDSPPAGDPSPAADDTDGGAARPAGPRVRRPPNGLLVIAGVLAVLVAFALWRTLGSAGAPRQASGPPRVTVVTPAVAEIEDTVSFTGTIAARDEMPITVEGEGGRISAVLVEVGERVRAGQVLARLDTSVLQPQVGSLAAALDEARASAELARADYRRAAAVAASGALSAEEIERRRSAAIGADAKVKVAAAQLQEARARLRRTEIRAPEAGLVLTRAAEVGQTATGSGEPLFRLSRGGQVELRGQVAEQDLPRLAPGQPVRVRVTGVEAPFVGQVRLLGAVIDAKTRLGSVRVDLEPHPNLRPGAFARAEVAIGRARRPVLPQSAVLSDVEGTYVLTVGADDTVARRPVTVAGSEREGLVISAGLQGGERIVLTAGPFLRLGEKIDAVPLTGGGGAAAPVRAVAPQ
ncbi:MAG: efflux RND transporter periplasmic adaptor subunit [Steroidobacteraceae bacterium]|jgi:RND family efflux transporter MFP subunit|nr:efflux RND transporter periplasmic adaptor subunit [Steroidobacteraceae bacterium]